MKVLFICTGNTCRSPMAEGILNDLAKKNNLKIEALSAGTNATQNASAAKFAIEAMEELGIDISSHRSNQVNSDLVEEADLVLTMSNTHKKYLVSQFPMSKEKVFLLKEYAFGKTDHIEDPFGAPFRYYEKARDEIYEAVVEIVKKVNNEQ